MDSGQHADHQGPGIVGTFLRIVVMIAFIVGLSWALRTFVFQTYEIPSGSMEETIQTGDMVFAEKVSYYFRDPEPGDIVTFNDPEIPGRVLIKRCIAVGGQTVDLVDGRVVIDGVPRYEPYTNGLPSEPLYGSDVTFPYTVPQGSIWVMGDNRTNSQDSRYFGAVTRSSVTGHAVLIYWPFDNFSSLN